MCAAGGKWRPVFQLPLCFIASLPPRRRPPPPPLAYLPRRGAGQHPGRAQVDCQRDWHDAHDAAHQGPAAPPHAHPQEQVRPPPPRCCPGLRPRPPAAAAAAAHAPTSGHSAHTHARSPALPPCAPVLPSPLPVPLRCTGTRRSRRTASTWWGALLTAAPSLCPPASGCASASSCSTCCGCVRCVRCRGCGVRAGRSAV